MKHHKNKLTMEQADAIRAESLQTTEQIQSCADRHGISYKTVREIMVNRRYHNPNLPTGSRSKPLPAAAPPRP